MATRKQIAFDLDTNALKKYYPSESWHGAYDVIERHMEKYGFKRIQGSVYVSLKATDTAIVDRLLYELTDKNPWLHKCMRDCRETNIGRSHSKDYIFDKDADIPIREQSKKQSSSDMNHTSAEFFAKNEQADKPEEKLKRATKRYVR